jgi:hypothetical protein
MVSTQYAKFGPEGTNGNPAHRYLYEHRRSLYIEVCANIALGIDWRFFFNNVSVEIAGKLVLS